MYQRQNEAPESRVREIREHPTPIEASKLYPGNTSEPDWHEADQKALHIPRRIFELSQNPK